MTGPGFRIRADGNRRSAAELVLAYAVFGLGLALVTTIEELATGPGRSNIVLLVYPLLIQLPLAIHYDRALGITAEPDTKWRFVGSRLFHPVVVYGLFFAFVIGAWGVLTGVWSPTPPTSGGFGRTIGTVLASTVTLAFGDPPFVVYFPVIVLVALLLKWGQSGVRLLRSPPDLSLDTSSSTGGDVGDTADALDGGRDDSDDSPGKTTPHSLGRDGLFNGRHVRFVSLLGLVLLPIGTGWAVNRPEFGVSVASLLLTVYQMAYRPRSTD